MKREPAEAEPGPYDDPELRERLKEEIRAGGEGGRPGQWSARKSQRLAQEYERHGGGYVGGKTEAQRSLEAWSAQDWQTREGSGEATGEGEDGSTRRYLPKEAWALLSPADRRATDRKKQVEGGRAHQRVANTPAARAARAWVTEGDPRGLSVPQLRRLTTKALRAIATREQVPGRSKLDHDGLARAIHAHLRRADRDAA